MERFPLHNLATCYEPRAFHLYGEACGNCGETAEHLTYIAEFDYYGCETCREEAERVIAREEQPEPIPAGACMERVRIFERNNTIDDIRLELRAHESECAQCGCTRKTVVSDRVLLGEVA